MPDQTQRATKAGEPDGLDGRIRGAAPEVTEPRPEVLAELERMASAARTEDRPVRRRQTFGRAAAIGLASAVALGGGAAAAASVGGWSWFAEEQRAELTYSFDLPSGAQCEARYGRIITSDPEARTALREIFAGLDVETVATESAVQTEIDRMRSEGPEERTAVLDDGSEVPADFGTEYYPSPDQEYQNAYYAVVSANVADQLDERGVDVEDGLFNYSAEIHCPGADWIEARETGR